MTDIKLDHNIPHNTTVIDVLSDSTEIIRIFPTNGGHFITQNWNVCNIYTLHMYILPFFSCSRFRAACSLSLRTKASRARSLASSASDFSFSGSITALAAAAASLREGLQC